MSEAEKVLESLSELAGLMEISYGEVYNYLDCAEDMRWALKGLKSELDKLYHRSRWMPEYYEFIWGMIAKTFTDISAGGLTSPLLGDDA